jgi:hypothetical protein
MRDLLRLATGLLALLAACGGGTDSMPVAATRDSAGIRIVENAALSAEAEPAATLSAEPILLLGRLNGPTEEQFGQVVGVQRQASGEIVVADARNFELRVFDSTGGFVRRIGQRGEGPGDFNRLGRLVMAPGQLVTWDYALRRLTWFDGEGNYLRDRKLADPPKVTSPDGHVSGTIVLPHRLLDDGTVLTTAGRIRFNTPSGNYRDSLDVWIADTAGTIERVGTFFDRAHYTYDTNDGWITFGSTPFGPTPAFVMHDAGWIHTGGAQFEYREMALDGSVARIVRTQQTPPAVTEQDRVWFRDSLYAEYEGEGLEHEKAALDWAEWSDSMPAYDRLMIDDGGHVWARHYPYTAPTATWDLFAPDGTLLGTVAVPADLTVRQIGADWLLATRKGDLDEPMVVLFRLTRRR